MLKLILFNYKQLFKEHFAIFFVFLLIPFFINYVILNDNYFGFETFSTNALYMELTFFISLVSLIFYAGYFSSQRIDKNKFAFDLSNITIVFLILFLIRLIKYGFNYNFFFDTFMLLFDSYYFLGFFGYFVKVFVIFFSIITLILTRNFTKFSAHNSVEFPIILLFASFLLFLLPNFYDFFSIFIITESLFFLFLGLIIMKFSRSSIETVLKYFVQNVFVSGLSLLGIMMMYYSTKTLNFFILFEILIYDETSPFFIFGFGLFLLSFLFKLGTFPVHFYVADVYEVSPIPTIYYFSALVKPVFFFVLINIATLFYAHINSLSNYFIFTGVLSMIIGSYGALIQTNLRRFLGYTSINQYGFLLICFSTNDSLIYAYLFSYIVLYSLVQFFLFFVLDSFYITSINIVDSAITTFSDLYNVLKNQKLYKFLVTIFLFFVAGLPPFVLFVFKYYLLVILMQNNFYFLVLFILLINTINIFYYLNIVKTIWFEETTIKDLKLAKNNYFLNRYYYYRDELNLFVLYFIIFLIIVFLMKFDAFLCLVVKYVLNGHEDYIWVNLIAELIKEVIAEKLEELKLRVVYQRFEDHMASYRNNK